MSAKSVIVAFGCALGTYSRWLADINAEFWEFTVNTRLLRARYALSALSSLLRYVNHTLVAWATRKFKRFKGRKTLAGRFFERLAKARPDVFVHWQHGVVGTFA